jgi:hypothetical protein
MNQIIYKRDSILRNLVVMLCTSLAYTNLFGTKGPVVVVFVLSSELGYQQILP